MDLVGCVVLFQCTREPVEERRDAPYSRYDKQWCDLFSANEDIQKEKAGANASPLNTTNFNIR